mmetsp:Transcript_7326/g.18640  ORF Transcript_7326/g.18640 Transcript_7326/m.18640 type:complete len:223 (+) Transcript_7326:164-832(+)
MLPQPSLVITPSSCLVNAPPISVPLPSLVKSPNTIAAKSHNLVNGPQVHVFIRPNGLLHVLPPRVQKPLGDDPKPGRPPQARAGIHHAPQLVPRDPARGVDLLRVGVHVHVRARPAAHHQDVVHLVLAPRPAAHRLVLSEVVRRAVVQPREVLERPSGHLRGRDAELVLQLAHGGALGAGHGAAGDVLGGVHLRGLVPVQRVRAARVGPHAGERDLGCRALL